MEKINDGSGEVFKNIYFSVIESKIKQLLSEGAITQKYAQGILERSSLVEGPFNDGNAAKNAAEDFLTVVNRIVEYFKDLGEAEMRLITIQGQIDILESEDSLSVRQVTDIYKDLLDTIENLYEKYPQYSKDNIMSILAASGNVDLLSDKTKEILESNPETVLVQREELLESLGRIKKEIVKIVETIQKVRDSID